MNWIVDIHPKAVEEINDLPIEVRARLARIVDLMTEHGPFALRAPHVKPLNNKLWEVRLMGKDCIARIIYVVLKNKKISFMHAFVKKTQKTPKLSIEKALNRLMEN